MVFVRNYEDVVLVHLVVISVGVLVDTCVWSQVSVYGELEYDCDDVVFLWCT